MGEDEAVKKNWLFRRIIRQGDLKHRSTNILIPLSDVVTRQPDVPMRSDKYFICNFCCGRIKRRYRSKHLTSCREAASGLKKAKKIKEIKNFQPIIKYDDDQLYVEVLEPLKNGKCLRVLKNHYLHSFAARLWKKKLFDKAESIRKILRDLLFLEEALTNAYRCSYKKQIQDFLTMGNVGPIIKVIKDASGFHKEPFKKPELMKPTKAERLCRVIEQFAEFCMLKQEIEENCLAFDRTKRFLALFKNESETELKKLSYVVNKRRWYNKVDVLPLSSDIADLHRKLEEDSPMLTKEFKSNLTCSAWIKLANNVMSRLELWNKRREGEVGKIKVEELRNCEVATKAHIGNMSDEVKETLDDISKDMLNNYYLLETEGKTLKKVTVVIRKDLLQIMKLFAMPENRKTVGVPEINEFLFAATRGSLKNLSAGRALRTSREDPGLKLKNASAITGTSLRKHLATVTQSMDLTENQQDELANHLSHNILIHRKFYRKAQPIVELTSVNKLLNLSTTNTVKRNINKTLSEAMIPEQSQNSPEDQDSALVQESAPKDSMVQPASSSDDRRREMSYPDTDTTGKNFWFFVSSTKNY